MPKVLPAFFAYPSSPSNVAHTIQQAIEKLKINSGVTSIHPWPESDIAGRFIADETLETITQLNFNVAYEIGFALALEKRVILTRQKGVNPAPPLIH